MRSALARGGAVLACLAALVVVTQLPSFAHEAIDWDEATFMLMAQDILRGHLPYLGLFDNKPPVAFVLLAGVIGVFGASVDAVRWFGDACIWLSAAMIYATLRPRSGTLVGILAAAAFIAAHDVKFGMHTSIEIIANVFLTGAMLVLLRYGHRGWSPWLVGVLMALATLTRGNLIVATAAIGLVYVVAAFRPGFLGLARSDILRFIAGGLIVALALTALYAGAGGINELLLATVAVPLSYASGQGGIADVATSLINAAFLPANDMAGVQRGLFIVAGVGALLALLPGAPRGQRIAVLVPVTMFVAVLASIVAGGVFYAHYTLQLYPALALIVGLGVVAPGGWKRALAAVGSAAVVGLALYNAVPLTFEHLAKPRDQAADRPLLAMAQQIAGDRQPDDQVWALTNHLVLAYLDQPPLSRAGTHPDNLVRPEIIDPLVAYGYVAPDELGRLMKLRPRYVVTQRDGTVFYLHGARQIAFNRMIAKDYLPWAPGPTAVVFRRKDGQ